MPICSEQCWLISFERSPAGFFPGFYIKKFKEFKGTIKLSIPVFVQSKNPIYQPKNGQL